MKIEIWQVFLLHCSWTDNYTTLVIAVEVVFQELGVLLGGLSNCEELVGG